VRCDRCGLTIACRDGLVFAIFVSLYQRHSLPKRPETLHLDSRLQIRIPTGHKGDRPVVGCVVYVHPRVGVCVDGLQT
jgi:hypothetical protein